MNWNHIKTVFGIIGLILFGIALLAIVVYWAHTYLWCVSDYGMVPIGDVPGICLWAMSG